MYPLVYVPYSGATEDEDKETKDEEIDPKDLLITGSADTSIKVWSMYNGECIKVKLLQNSI